jgi:hypothetical protein
LGKLQGQKRSQAAVAAAQTKLQGGDKTGAMQDLTLGGHGDIAKQLSKLDAAAVEAFSKKMQITGGVYGALADVQDDA